jgi:hypothetical protein
MGSRSGSVTEQPLIKDPVLMAAEQVGEDGRGKGGLVGYFMRLAVRYPRVFANLLARVLNPAGQ